MTKKTAINGSSAAAGARAKLATNALNSKKSRHYNRGDYHVE